MRAKIAAIISSMKAILLAALLLAGCATVSENECRTGDWYARGYQEALMGNRPRIDQYKAQCPRFGAAPDEAKYMEGWRLGYSEYDIRTSGGRM